MVYPHTFRTEHSETKTTNGMYGAYYAFIQSKKIRIQPTLLKILNFVDSNRNKFVDDLAEFIRIKSVSGKLEYREEIMKMIKFVESWLVKLGLKYECFDIGYHEIDGKKVRLPPVILASLGADPKKKTLCVYTYLDVKEPDKKLWTIDPWELIQEEKTVWGCGVSSGKSSLMSWFHMIQAFKASKTEIPVNLKFMIESMFQQDSKGLEDFLSTRKQDFLFNIDCVVVCESEWLGEKHPCLIYGTVGILHFKVTIEKKEGSSTEPKDDMEAIFSKLSDDEGNILIPNFNNFVEQITPDEERMYENIVDFDLGEYRESLPPYKQNWGKVKLLMNFWRLPGIILDELQECTCEKKEFTKVKRHFILKIVPRQSVGKSQHSTIQYVESLVKKLNIENKVECEMISSIRPWVEDFRSPNYEAARKATIQIYKEDPNMIREDKGSIAITILDRALEKSVLYLPLASRGTTTAVADESMPKRNIIEGTKLLAAYLFHLANAYAQK